MKKFTSCICNKVNGLVLRARTALSNQRGEFYISDAVKIIIARITQAREGLCAYAQICGGRFVDSHNRPPLFVFQKTNNGGTG